MPPVTPPTTPPSTPLTASPIALLDACLRLDLRRRLDRRRRRVHVHDRLRRLLRPAEAAGGGGGGGGGGGAATNAIIEGGVGSTSAAISGMMTTAADESPCARGSKAERYTRLLLPTLIDGLDDVAEHVTWHGLSPPRGLASSGRTALIGGPACRGQPPVKGGDYSQSKIRESTKLSERLDTGILRNRPTAQTWSVPDPIRIP